MVKRGSSLVEIMVGLLIMSFALALVGNATIQSAQQMSKNQSVVDTATQARQTLAKMTGDINFADMCLAQYPPNGVSQFVADKTSTVIIRQPNFDGNGDPVAGSYTVVIYRLEDANASEIGPKVVKRYKGQITNGTATQAILDKVLLTNVQAAHFTFTVDELFHGNNSAQTFTLVGTPTGNDTYFTQHVYTGGIDELPAGHATISGNNVNFDQIVANGIPVDVEYQVDPSQIVNTDGGNYASHLAIRLRILPQWRQADQSVKTRSVVLDASAQLGNHS